MKKSFDFNELVFAFLLKKALAFNNPCDYSQERILLLKKIKHWKVNRGYYLATAEKRTQSRLNGCQTKTISIQQRQNVRSILNEWRLILMKELFLIFCINFSHGACSTVIYG